MESTMSPVVPPPMPEGGARKARFSGWAIAALVCAVLFLPLVPILLGVIGMVKIHNSRGGLRGMPMAMVAVGLGVVQFVVGLLAGLAAPAILQARKKAEMTMAVSNAKCLGCVLYEFEQDWGEFPSRKVFEENREQFGALTLADDANFYLGMLVAGGYMAGEEAFQVRGGSASSRKPDNVVVPSSRLLEAGECGFGYVMLEGGKALKGTDNPSRVLLVAPLAPGSRGRDPEFNAQPFDRKAIYLGLDQSVQATRIERGKALGKWPRASGSLFATGEETPWGKEVPDVKPPR